MCGIAGVIGRIDDTNRGALKRMNDAMSHRGPDGEGFWEASPDDAGWGAMLAHRRLSILDLTNAAAQPMVDPTVRNVVVLNGEIYNYVELRKRLISAGHDFRSTGDTAVMLRALCVDGPRALKSLRGMFAFAYWNVRDRSLLIARDPLGIKPLYIVQNADPRGNWSIAFASEVRAILKRTARYSETQSSGGRVHSLEWFYGGAADRSPADRVGHAGRAPYLRLSRIGKRSREVLGSCAAQTSRAH